MTDPPAAAPPTEGAPGSQPAEAEALIKLLDGLYTSGNFKAEVGGPNPMSVDLALTGGPSMTGNGFTSLFYNTGNGADSIIVQFVIDETGGGAISFTSPTVILGGGVPEGCVTTIDRNDASGIAGTFKCPDLAGMTIEGSNEVKASIDATFSAEH